jgi:hypothetical protein
MMIQPGPACLILSFLIVLSPVVAGPQDMRDKQPVRSQISTRVDSLLIEYKKLRKLSKAKKAGEHIPAVDDYNGSFHTVMLTLGDEIGKRQLTKKQLIVLMDEPDTIIRAKNSVEVNEEVLPLDTISREDHLIYKWRGFHDYLYFICKSDSITGHEWYHAFER